MFTPITFPSALIFWLTFDGKKEVTPIGPGLQTDTDPIRLPGFAAENNLNAPLHIFVPRQELRHRGNNMIAHVLPRGIPRNSFVSVSGVPIISPELCFLLAAKYLSLADLSVLCTDLCASYAADQQAAYKQISRYPVTSVRRISDYLTQVQRVDGIQNAGKAIRFALDGSHSPMESKISVTSILPFRYGGFAIESPKLNAMVGLTVDGAAHFKRDMCCCDMLWEKQKVIVEYDSDLAHSSMNQIRQDKKKMTALGLSGYTVIEATKDHFRNVNTVEELFLGIRKTLGIRNRLKAFEETREIRRSVIIRLFLTENSLDWKEWAKMLEA